MALRHVFPTLAALMGLACGADVPKVGSPAPGFEAKDQHGRTISLRDFKGKSAVVLYFYPKDDTPGCTAQACSLRDGHAGLLAAGAVVLGVSADDARSHAAFAQKFNLPFSLLEDPEKRLIEAYGVKMPALPMAKRWTFIIDKQGILRHIIQDVTTKGHDQQVIALLRSL